MSALGSAPGAALALTDLSVIEYSPDITVQLGLDDAVIEDHDSAGDDLAGTVVEISLGDLPDAADVIGYHVARGDALLLALDVASDLGALTVRPGDVVRLDGAGPSLEFDARASGLPPGVLTDAVTMSGNDLVLSFDVTVDLGAGLTVADEDLVSFDGARFTLFLDGSEAGVPTALDLDAAHVLSNGLLLVSFDGAGTVGGVVFDDDDVLEHDPVDNRWELAFDGTAGDEDWRAADLDALDATEVSEAQCGDPTVDGEISPSDALIVLRAAVRLVVCFECVCDVNGVGGITPTDALLALQAAANLPVVLNCPPCA